MFIDESGDYIYNFKNIHSTDTKEIVVSFMRYSIDAQHPLKPAVTMYTRPLTVTVKERVFNGISTASIISYISKSAKDLIDNLCSKEESEDYSVQYGNLTSESFADLHLALNSIGCDLTGGTLNIRNKATEIMYTHSFRVVTEMEDDTVKHEDSENDTEVSIKLQVEKDDLEVLVAYMKTKVTVSEWEKAEGKTDLEKLISIAKVQ